MKEEVFQDLTQGIRATSTLIQSISSEITQNHIDIAHLKSKLLSLEEQNARLYKIVIDGNGQPAHSVRIVLLEQYVSTAKVEVEKIRLQLDSKFAEIKSAIDNLEKIDDEKREKTSDRIWGIVIQTVPYFLIAIITYLFTSFFNPNPPQKSNNTPPSVSVPK